MSDHGAAFGPGQGHHFRIGECDPAGMVRYGQDVVPLFAELAAMAGDSISSGSSLTA